MRNVVGEIDPESSFAQTIPHDKSYAKLFPTYLTHYRKTAIESFDLLLYIIWSHPKWTLKCIVQQLCGKERGWIRNSSMSLSNRLTQLRVSSVSVSLRYFLEKKEYRKINRKTNGWQADSKVADGATFFFLPPVGQRELEWKRNSRSDARLKKFNPLRLLLGHVKCMLRILAKTTRGTLRLFTRSYRESSWLSQAWSAAVSSAPLRFSFAPNMRLICNARRESSRNN